MHRMEDSIGADPSMQSQLWALQQLCLALQEESQIRGVHCHCFRSNVAKIYSPNLQGKEDCKAYITPRIPVDYPIIYRVLYIPVGAGFLPSTEGPLLGTFVNFREVFSTYEAVAPTGGGTSLRVGGSKWTRCARPLRAELAWENGGFFRGIFTFFLMGGS